MRKFRWLALLFTLLLVAAACGDSGDPTTTTGPTGTDPTTTTAAPDEGSIWVLLPDSASSARWETDDRRFFEQAFDAAGVDYTIVNAEGDARTQQTQAEQAITAGAKVILLVNLDSGSGAAIIAAARDAGVAVIDYDRLTIEGPGADVYVSFDNVRVGRTMYDVVAPVIDALPDQPARVVLLNGGPTDNNATLFRQGYGEPSDEKFASGEWEKVDEQAVPDWDNQQALVIYEQILTAAGGDVDAVFAANDGLANAVVSAQKNQGLPPIPVSGQDATVGGIQNILSGDQTMTVYKPIKAEAEAAAEAAVLLLRDGDITTLTGGETLNNGQSDVPFISLVPIGVTIDNIQETVFADGFRTPEEVCVGEYEALCAQAFGDAPPPAAFPPEAGPLGGVLIGNGEDIQIRALQAISGPVEFLGTDQVRGIELAIEDFGPVKGHDVNLGTLEDDLCNAEGGQAGAQAIVAQEGVLATIGTTCSGAGVPASQIISEAGGVLFSGSNTSPSLTSDLQGNPNPAWQPGYYRTAHNDLFQGAAAARFAFEVLGLTTAAAIHDGDPYTEGLASSFAAAFEDLGGTITTFTAVNKGDTDMVPVLTEVASGSPQVVYFPIFQPEGDFIIQQVDGVAGLADVVLFGADGLFVGDFLGLEESEGMYFSGPDLQFAGAGFTGTSYSDLRTRYETTYGEPPLAAFHAHTYDATMIVLNAIDQVGVEGPAGELWVDRQALRDALYATEDFPGVTGGLTCDEFGDCGSQSIAIFLHEDSTSEDPIADATVVAKSTLLGGFEDLTG